MKKNVMYCFLVCFFTIILIFGTSFARSTPKYLTASGQAFTGSGELTAINIVTDGTNSVEVLIYDGTSASGDPIAGSKVSGTSEFGGTLLKNVYFSTGAYVTITVDNSGTAKVFVYKDYYK